MDGAARKIFWGSPPSHNSHNSLQLPRSVRWKPIGLVHIVKLSSSFFSEAKPPQNRETRQFARDEEIVPHMKGSSCLQAKRSRRTWSLVELHVSGGKAVCWTSVPSCFWDQKEIFFDASVVGTVSNPCQTAERRGAVSPLQGRPPHRPPAEGCAPTQVGPKFIFFRIFQFWKNFGIFWGFFCFPPQFSDFSIFRLVFICGFLRFFFVSHFFLRVCVAPPQPGHCTPSSRCVDRGRTGLSTAKQKLCSSRSVSWCLLQGTGAPSPPACGAWASRTTWRGRGITSDTGPGGWPPFT